MNRNISKNSFKSKELQVCIFHLLNKNKCRSFLDMWAGNCEMIRFLKKNSNYLNFIIGLDINESLLIDSKGKFEISWYDYLELKEQPLEVYLIRDNILDPSSYFLKQIDTLKMNLDFLSLIQYSDVITKSTRTVFTKIKPQFVLIMFLDKIKNFQKWCKNLLTNYTDYEIDLLDFLEKSSSDDFEFDEICLFKRINHNIDTKIENNYNEYIEKLKISNFINHQQSNTDFKSKIQNVKIAPYFDSCFLNSDNEYKLVSFTRYPFKFSEFEKDIQLLIQCEDNDRDLISDFLKLINDEKFISLNNQYKILKYNKIDFLSYSKKYTLSIKIAMIKAF